MGLPIKRIKHKIKQVFTTLIVKHERRWTTVRGIKKTVYAGQSTIRFDDPEENEISESYVNGENVKK